MTDSEIDRNTLLGLDALAIRVRVSGFAGDLRKQLQAQVEERLHEAGIKILSLADWEKAPGRPLLYVVVTAPHREKPDTSPFGVLVELRQEVFLGRAPAISTWTTTWKVESAIHAGNDDLSEAYRSVTEKILDQFISAYHSVNAG